MLDLHHTPQLSTHRDDGQLDVEGVLVAHHVRAGVQLLLRLGQPVHAGLVAVQEVLVVVDVLLRVLHLFLSHTHTHNIQIFFILVCPLLHCFILPPPSLSVSKALR